MDADDPIDDIQAVTTHGAAAFSRAAEVLLRANQDRRTRDAMETARVTDELERRAAAQAAAADAFYERAARDSWVRDHSAEEVAATWKGARQWAELDPDRFQPRVDALEQEIATTRGVDVTQVDTSRGMEAAEAELRSALGQGVDRSGQGVAEAGELDYDSPARRAATDAALAAADVGVDARVARATADRLNGQHPVSAVQGPVTGKKSRRAGAHRPGPERGQGR